MKKDKAVFIDYVVESIALAFLFMSFFVVLLSYSKLPTSIHLGFGFNGSPEKVGHKVNLFFLPTMSTILYLLIATIQKNPQLIFNKFVTDGIKSEHKLRWSVRFLALTKLLINGTAFIILYLTIYSRMQDEMIISKVFLPVILIILLMPLFLLIFRFASEFRKLVK
ncbi:MAG: hypothetical protein ACK4KT_09805 [Thermaurantimonas sp.]